MELWILGAFWTSPTAGIEAIASLIPIHLHLKKLYNRFHLQGFSLPLNYIIKLILSPDRSTEHILHSLSLKHLTPKWRLCLKSPLINIKNRNNKFLSSFSPFNHEFSPENQLKDSFPDCFSFHLCSQDAKSHIKNLNNITFETSSNFSTAIIISDASIKNHVTTLISHIYPHNKPIIKKIHQAINVTTTEAELFAICCGINQVIGISNIKYIIVITDSIHAARRIFDSSMHSYQIHSATISQELRAFFMKNNNNCIEFWDCPSKLK